jgi:hypothetical protein
MEAPLFMTTIEDIRVICQEAGNNFFDEGWEKKFMSSVYEEVYEGDGGCYFITSESILKKNLLRIPVYYTVRQFFEEPSPKIISVPRLGDWPSPTIAHHTASVLSLDPLQDRWDHVCRTIDRKVNDRDYIYKEAYGTIEDAIRNHEVSIGRLTIHFRYRFSVYDIEYTCSVSEDLYDATRELCRLLYTKEYYTFTEGPDHDDECKPSDRLWKDYVPSRIKDSWR